LVLLVVVAAMLLPAMLTSMTLVVLARLLAAALLMILVLLVGVAMLTALVLGLLLILVLIHGQSSPWRDVFPVGPTVSESHLFHIRACQASCA
jgi:hypothetical protein